MSEEVRAMSDSGASKGRKLAQFGSIPADSLEKLANRAERGVLNDKGRKRPWTFSLERSAVHWGTPPVTVYRDLLQADADPHGADLRGARRATGNGTIGATTVATPEHQIAAVYRALERHEGAASVQEIVSVTGWSPGKTRPIVRRLVAEGRLAERGVTSTGAATYGVPKVEGDPVTTEEALAVLNEITSGLTAQIAAFEENARRAQVVLDFVDTARLNLIDPDLPVTDPRKRTRAVVFRWIEYHRAGAAREPVAVHVY